MSETPTSDPPIDTADSGRESVSKHLEPPIDSGDSAGDSGRDSLGRFAPGNALSKGNGGNAGKMRELRQAALAALTPEDVQEIIRALKREAIDGDTGAAAILLSYGIGKPTAGEEV